MSKERATTILDGWKFLQGTKELLVAIWGVLKLSEGEFKSREKWQVGGYAQSLLVDKISSISSVDVEGVGSVT